MLERPWRVALIDSGAPLSRAPWAAGLQIMASRRFTDVEGTVEHTQAGIDPTGHGTAVAEVIASAAKPIECVVAQVIDARGRSTPAAVAAAIRWILTLEVNLVHLSLGTQHNRQVLADAIADLGSSTIIVASSPARGALTYPAAYPRVIRATGDARCQADEISALQTGQADYGACPRHRSSAGRLLAGASIGAAHVSKFIVQNLPPGLPRAEIHDGLRHLAAHQGAERRLGP